mmetsp:Transcript_4955/g.7307  ORF Transcript_4955/g.7307 Transcript_4955/m.7307 type:complete len:98 (+) Transcript_4955:174-467(+)
MAAADPVSVPRARVEHVLLADRPATHPIRIQPLPMPRLRVALVNPPQQSDEPAQVTYTPLLVVSEAAHGLARRARTSNLVMEFTLVRRLHLAVVIKH